ncbi:MAG: preprotein translocase subunit YajC [Actinomycetales bacterium]|jgi:preprotein translocase subunit YajC|nr:preprotein translocase subunit YajC [Candidatus Phosphoribacter baldrii]MBK6955033.1 preprotein translocase subunit YajC [Candidatus Phosphoribacter baldrii]MBK7610325.1 preprotein translocase subunit YajC [Candidatus Phosphoribacter baldrii]HRC13661.1 preprotein translocase subunit YajC [Dermatophilaceae bacterium]
MASNDLSSLLFFAIPVGFIAYIFLGQRRRMRAMQELHSSIVVGDEVRTTSGLFGRVNATTDGEVHLEIAPGVVVRFDRRAVDSRVSSGPAAMADGPTDGPAQGE